MMGMQKRSLWVVAGNYLVFMLIIWNTVTLRDILDLFSRNPLRHSDSVSFSMDFKFIQYQNLKDHNFCGANFEFIQYQNLKCVNCGRINSIIYNRGATKNISAILNVIDVKINQRFMLDKRKRNYGFMMASAQKLPDFTTERSIFTGLVSEPPPTPPLKDFEFAAEVSSFATKVIFTLSWIASYNVTKITLRYNEKDGSIRIAELPQLDLSSNYTRNIYPPNHKRKGFRYKLVGFTKLSDYHVQAWASYYDRRGRELKLYDITALTTGESDRDERLYNLEGIFLVLGISTVIMVVVLFCVGYEKLIHQKRKDCVDVLCCRRKSKRTAKVHDSAMRGSISPEPLMVRRDANDHESGPFIRSGSGTGSGPAGPSSKR